MLTHIPHTHTPIYIYRERERELLMYIHIEGNHSPSHGAGTGAQAAFAWCCRQPELCRCGGHGRVAFRFTCNPNYLHVSSKDELY